MSLNKNKYQPLVSIITVVFNGEQHLKQTINSVLHQTYSNIEYIIIDGGSTDGTIDIIKEFEDDISYWISESDNGLYDAMNKGIKLAKGELIGMINSDDWYELDAVETVVKAASDYPQKNIFHADRYDVKSIDDKRLYKFNPSKFKFKFYAMTYNHPTMFMKKIEYDNHLYNSSLTVLADYQFILEAYLRSPESIYYIERPIVNYRLSGVSSRMSMKCMLSEGFIARKKAGLNLAENIFALAVRFCARILIDIRNYFKG